MAGARIWPNGVISGWCLVGNDHHRCAGPHVADPAVSGCHCAVCLDREANPPAVVDDAPNPAEAPPAPEPGASAGTNDASGPGGRFYRTAPDTDPLTVLGLATLRLERVLELHCEAPRIGSARVRPSCAHCGRHYPCPTAQFALGEAS